MRKLILILLLFPLVSFGQNDGYELCYKLGNRSFNTNTDAIKSFQKVLAVANLKTNRFVILPCDNISNAMASVYEGFRYILYKESWINQSDYWSKMAILAHEVGHHINGHTLSGYSLNESRQVELEADDWAGYAMAKIGASLAQTLELTKRVSTGDDTNSTHPNRAKRIAALTSGWNIGSEKTTKKVPEKYVPDSSNISAEEYYNRANEKSENGDENGAIVDYTKAIELAPNNADAYNNRGVSKRNLKDHNGAIVDYTKAIEKKPDYANAYNNMGVSKVDLKDYPAAIADYTKAIELDPDYANAYNNRGASKGDLKDYQAAIADYTKAIELDPDYADAYVNRGVSKENLGDLNGACKDWKKAASLGEEEAAKWVRDDCN
jgi:tetratricopeptide (TPR) repeat protein